MSDRNFWPSEAQFARLFIAVAGVAGQKTGRGRKYPDIRENVRGSALGAGLSRGGGVLASIVEAAASVDISASVLDTRRSHRVG